MDNSATFHQLLSNTAFALSRLEPNDVSLRSNSMAHHGFAIKTVRATLNRVDSHNSMALIPAILSLAIHAHMSENFATWKMHMAALARILNLMSVKSPSDLPSNLRFLLPWVDVTDSVKEDSYPYFSHPNWRFPLFTLPDDTHDNMASLTELSVYDDAEFLQTLVQVRKVFRVIEWQPKAKAEYLGEPSVAARVVTPLFQRLLIFRPSNHDPEHYRQAKDAIRLATMISLAQVRRHFLGFQVSSHVHTAKLHMILKSFAFDFEVKDRQWFSPHFISGF